MKPVLVLQNQTTDHPTYLTTWLNKNNISHEVINSQSGEPFPDSIEPYSALAVMGGAMSANDPLLSNRQAEILILQSMYRDKPVIGHCLGGQLMAKALGAKVVNSPQPEIGWQPIEWVNDPLVKYWFGDSPTNHVMHWHYDSFNIPTGAILLGSSSACPNQCFSIGPHLAMQFHIEIDIEKIDVWLSEDDPDWAPAKERYKTVQSAEEIRAGISQYLSLHKNTADSIYSRWISHTRWAN